MNGGWHNVELGDVLRYTQPTKFIVESTDYSDEFEVPVLTAGKSFILGHTDEKEGHYVDLPTIIFDDFTTSFHFVDFPFKVKSSAMKMLNLSDDACDIKFLYYLMRTIRFDPDEHKRYWISKFSKFRVAVPPLEEQKRIAGILDEADRVRKKTQALIDKYDELAQSLFLDMFGDLFSDSTIPLGDLVEFSQGIQIGIENQRLQPEEGFERFLRIIDFTQGDDLRFVPQVDEKYRVKHDDIVMVRYGTVGFVGTNKEGVLANNLFKINYDRKRFNQMFLFHVFQHARFKRFIEKEAYGATMPALSFKVMRTYDIPCPSLKMQNLFAEQIGFIDGLKGTASNSLSNSAKLFNALLQKAFKGELN